MSTFADFYVDAGMPARYRDARSGLRFRVVDVTEQEAPDVLVITEIGDGLLAALMWERIAVTADAMKTGGVSIYEAMATVIANIDVLEVETSVKETNGAKIHLRPATDGFRVWSSRRRGTQGARTGSSWPFPIPAP